MGPARSAPSLPPRPSVHEADPLVGPPEQPTETAETTKARPAAAAASARWRVLCTRILQHLGILFTLRALHLSRAALPADLSRETLVACCRSSAYLSPRPRRDEGETHGTNSQCTSYPQSP